MLRGVLVRVLLLERVHQGEAQRLAVLAREATQQRLERRRVHLPSQERRARLRGHWHCDPQESAMPGQLKPSCIRKIALLHSNSSVRASILRSSQASDAICRHAAVASSELVTPLGALCAPQFITWLHRRPKDGHGYYLLSGDQAGCRGKARKGGVGVLGVALCVWASTS